MTSTKKQQEITLTNETATHMTPSYVRAIAIYKSIMCKFTCDRCKKEKSGSEFIEEINCRGNLTLEMARI